MEFYKETRFKSSEIWKVPESWNITNLESEYLVIMGQSPPSKTYNNDGKGLPFFQGNFDFGYMYPNVRIFCDKPIKIA